MPKFLRLPIVTSLLLLASALPAWADSSSVVSTSFTSVGSLSVSIERSSASISGNGKVAQGDYRVVDVAALEQQPDQVRVHLQALAGNEAFYLRLPREAAARGLLQPGQVVSAQQRPYGLAFAKADSPQSPFFLVLDDAWYRELDSRAVAG